MKKYFILVTTAATMLLSSIFTSTVSADDKKDEFKSLNSLIEVGDDIYVQHDSDNNNVYDLKKSSGGKTTVYKVVIPEFTAGKAWTTTGDYVDNWCKEAHGATAPEDYIPVKAGEEYFIRTYGVGWTGKNEDGSWWPFYAPVLFLNDKNEVIGDALTNTLSKSKAGVTFTVPSGATKMHITMYNNQNFTLQKILKLTDTEFSKLPINKTSLESKIKDNYSSYTKDRVIYEKPDKAYITFVNDDTWGSIDEFSKMFIEKDIPLVLATIPDLLIENASSQKETRLDVARKVEKAGGEIIAHNREVVTKESFLSYDEMYAAFVRSKQMFNYYGFDVNGIILAGGQGQVTGAMETERWATSVYSYSDLYGQKYDNEMIALDSVYYHYRTGLGNFKNDYERITQIVDDAIANKKWIVFYFHTYTEIEEGVLEKVLDYVASKKSSDLEVVTYKEMYQKNAIRESEILNKKTTYYVSATGTSLEGTSQSSPMSYEMAKNKTYMSGDTILFKRGDTFYGTFDPKIYNADGKVTKISSYGTGKLPVISGYKIADSSSSWQLHDDGIYKINLTDTKKFSGLKTTDSYSSNIGFIEDKNGNKLYNKKASLAECVNEYDFYCDSTYLYIKSKKNPYNALGVLKLATRTNLLITSSNMKIENLKLCGTGAHGMVNSDDTVVNVEICRNVIENIGGSYLNGTTRYGNGIEFYGADVSKISVHDNIIRNTYDVGFTIQGNEGSGKNVTVKKNVFVQNSHDSEIWESGSATGVNGYEFANNLSINVGRGWGYEARPDKYHVAHILFWGYTIENTDIYFHNNTVYNPRRLYFIEETNKTDVFFKERNFIRSDYNNYMLADDATIYRHLYKLSEKNAFVLEFNKDKNSIFDSIKVDDNIVKTAAKEDDINKIRKLFSLEEEETSAQTEEKTTTKTTEEDNTSVVKNEETTSVKIEEATSKEVDDKETAFKEDGEVSTISSELDSATTFETISRVDESKENIEQNGDIIDGTDDEETKNEDIKSQKEKSSYISSVIKIGLIIIFILAACIGTITYFVRKKKHYIG